MADHTVIDRLIAVTKAYGSNDADSLDVANMARRALPALSSQAAEIERLTKELRAERDWIVQATMSCAKRRCSMLINDRDDAESRATAAEQRVAVLEGALQEYLDANEAWAKAQLSAENAQNNFSDSRPEKIALGKALSRASEAEKAARRALSPEVKDG